MIRAVRIMILVVKLQRTRAPMMLNNLVPWKAGSAFFENRYYGNSWIGSLFSPIRLKKEIVYLTLLLLELSGK